MRPMISAAQIGTKPAPGVIPTKPATIPVQAPTNVGFLLTTTSQNIQDSIAAAEETAVVTNA